MMKSGLCISDTLNVLLSKGIANQKPPKNQNRDYINDLSKNDLSEVHSCEIEEADFYVGSYSICDRTRAFYENQFRYKQNSSF